MTYALIIVGAAIGAPLRYFVQVKVHALAGPGLPWGTILVNLSGCLVMGLLAALAEERHWLGRDARLFLMVGFLGSYTTFSTFGWEAFALLKGEDLPRALGTMLLSTVGGVAAVWAGTALARVA